MKKIFNILLIIGILTALISCGKKEDTRPEIDIYATTEEQTTATKEPQKSQIVIFADISLTEYMNIIKQDYENNYSNVHIIYQFDTSESLKNQIVDMADCDVFISNSSLLLDQIDINNETDNKDMLDFIAPNTRTIVFNGNTAIDSDDNYEACVIRLGANNIEAKRFIDFLLRY